MTPPPAEVGAARTTPEAQRWSERRLHALWAAMGAVVWVANGAGALVGDCAGWCALTGQAREQAAGRGWLDAVHPDDRERTARAWAEAVAARAVWHSEHRVRRRDGEYRLMSARAVPVLDNDGAVHEWVGVHTDVTDARRAVDERERMARTLARREEDLEQFVYVASHDLRAPLRGIANLAQWLEDDLGERLDGDGREHLRLLLNRVARMEALLDGMLSYSRAGRMPAAAEPVDLEQLLGDVVARLDPRPPAVVDVDPGLPTVQAERAPLLQVFLHLVGNALKHAGRPDARVEVRCADAGACWVLSVADNGQGIAPEYHERIWGIFQTLESRDRVEGAGIGLSVVKKIVESRGGRVWVESARGAGATFFVRWPKQPQEAS